MRFTVIRFGCKVVPAFGLVWGTRKLFRRAGHFLAA